MRDRPILFSGEMVRAILDGRKTQTRRAVKPQPDFVAGNEKIVARFTPDDCRLGRLGKAIQCPHGQPGDRLWVRETFADEGCRMRREDCYYRADGECDLQGGRWTPSIHMPRWASRITLEITGVRVERLQDISEEDAIAEGPPGLKFPAPPGSFWVTDDGRRKAFRSLWESINGPESWKQNPWVWVIEFKRLESDQ